MELGFGISKLGALSKISFNLKDVATAAYLLHRWYKIRRSNSEQTLASNGVSLATVSTFNRILCADVREQHGGTWGVAPRTDGFLARVRLPKASTALEGDPRVVCLRALTIGLMCFVEQAQVGPVLKEILPRRILQYNQEGIEFLIERPSLAALLDYVRAIAKEEIADQLRVHLLDYTDSQIQRVTCASLNDLLACRETEIGHIIGFLDCLPTPASK